MGKRTLVYDVEGNGLLKATRNIPAMTKLHCLAVEDAYSDDAWFFPPDRIKEGIEFLQDEGELTIAHNGADYDHRAIKHLNPWWKAPKILDTLIICRMVWPAETLMDRDYKLFLNHKMPGKLLKRQSIEAWGYRLGIHKVGADITDWTKYTDYMGERCVSDVKVNKALWLLARKRLGWDPKNPPEDGFIWSEFCVDLEHRVAELMREQEDTGFKLDKPKAIRLAKDLGNAQADIEEALGRAFPAWWQPLDDPKVGRRAPRAMKEKLTHLPDVTIPRKSEKTGKELKPYVGPPVAEYTPEAPFVRIKRMSFNASSKDHLGERLVAEYGWRPTKFSPKTGKPTLDEGVVAEIPEHILPPGVKKMLQNYFVIAKTRGTVSIGNKSYLGLVNEATGRIHGRCDPLGTITMRGAHKDPNLGNVASVELNEVKDANGKVVSKEPIKGVDGGYGWESRDLFTVDEGNELTGTDASGLELRDLGHRLHPFDKGAFTKRVSDPSLDIHEENSKLTGLSRKDTKTTTYKTLYGSGPLPIGIDVGVTPEELPELLTSKELNGYLRYMQRRDGEKYVRPDDMTCALIAKGSRVKKKFESGIEGLMPLKLAITATAKRQKWLEGLDGRKIFVRKEHAALNSQLQSDGAIICKLWMVLTHRNLKAQGLVPGVDFKQVAWVHDELQIEHKAGLGPVIGKASREAIEKAGEILKVLCPLASEHKTGRTWAETH
ncbi:DNA polymerase [Aestuariivirga sp. YIM B02566]|uniref:Uncharacterized protein n=1 Tax=Taklimakanibacter albus TaxID=2800327 RepID=A0ACC5RFX8_9HYPH|nr:DNA polymerase [Aestuariivirga sp. YIM B02566]MBK1871558.1 hypothetical protein [Aestuariivirga sp. YIM B02566]